MSSFFLMLLAASIAFGFMTVQASDIPVPHKSDTITALTENPDVETQIKGNYPALERVETLPLGAIQHAWDKAPLTAGVYQVVYRPSEVMRMRTREYMTTTVILPPWERIDEMISGDEGAYAVRKAKDNIILIRPQEFVGIDTTLTLIGASGRVYNFYMRSEGYNSKNVSDVSVLVKVPVMNQAALRAQNQEPLGPKETSPDYLDDAYVNPSDMNFAFSMAGDKEIAPERVYSDGIRTWFDYGDDIKKRNLPTIYKVEDGIDEPTNVNREGNKLVAQAVGTFTLKHGAKVVCVFPSHKMPSSQD